MAARMLSGRWIRHPWVIWYISQSRPVVHHFDHLSYIAAWPGGGIERKTPSAELIFIAIVDRYRKGGYDTSL